MDYFKIDGLELAFSETSKVEFVDGKMHFELRAEPFTYDEDKHKGIFSDYSYDAENLISPGFRSSAFVLFSKAGERTIRYPENRDDFYLWELDFDFGLRFFGEVNTDGKILRMNGILKHSWEDDDAGIAVELAKTFELGEVEVADYIYKSLEETQAVDPAEVKRLDLDAQGTAGFSAEILEFTNLRSLRMSGINVDTLPADIGKLSKLETLSIDSWYQGPKLGELADTFFDLTALKTLNLSGHDLSELSPKIAHLTQLEFLNLSYNPLTTLPDEICSLPLKTLRLSGTKLRSLPDGIGDMPQLSHLYIKGNDFVSLPESLDNIKHLALEPKYKSLYKDARYQAASDAPIDQDLFKLAPGDERAQRLQTLCKNYGLEAYYDALLKESRPTLIFKPAVEDDYSEKGVTRFGGMPDLPPELAYPHTADAPWTLIAQLNLEELEPLQAYLPRKGILYFFADHCFDMYNVRVLYSPTTQGLETANINPEKLEACDLVPYRMSVHKGLSLPNTYGAYRRFGESSTLAALEEEDKAQDALFKLQDELEEGFKDCHLMNANVFTQHESPEEQAAEALGGLEDEWLNLLMVHSDHSSGFQFGDYGTLTFTVHKQDLMAVEFGTIYDSVESS